MLNNRLASTILPLNLVAQTVVAMNILLLLVVVVVVAVVTYWLQFYQQVMRFTAMC